MARGVGRVAHHTADMSRGNSLPEQFYRVPSPDNERIPGTGLGLTLVQHIVSAHGGTITVQSEVGEGSTFAMHLPLERADS